jgi:phosphonate degradation associated HDIG domain protein
MALSIPDICAVFDAKGARMYTGEPVTQLEHALQSAALAEDAGADAALITAALLHDLGHMLNEQGETPTARGVDDVHQYVALPFLRPLFDEAVLEPIRLHVDAKRYLCATRPAYYDALSADSKRSLVLQGRAYTPDEARAFAALPGAERALRLRLWDDSAKAVARVTPPLSHFVSIMQTAAASVKP